MSYLEAIFLGVIQGLTEFLPISSSGHLVLTQELLGVNQPGVTFELLLHLGTLLAVLVYFRRRILAMAASIVKAGESEDRRLVWLLIVGTIPAGLAGVLLKDTFEQAFSSPVFTASMLLVTGALLLSTRFVPKQRKSLTWLSAILMGIGQALAILPGISRSGSTIAAGLLVGVKPERAAEFSFLLAVPAIAGAVVLKIDEFLSLDAALAGQYVAGTLAAFVFGLVAVYAVLATIRRGKFEYFAYYCFAAGVVALYIFI